VTSLPKAIEPASGSTDSPASRPPVAAPAVSTFAPIEGLLGGPDVAARGTALRWPFGRGGFWRDPLNGLAVAIAVPVVLIALLVGREVSVEALALAGVFVTLQLACGWVRRAPRVMPAVRFAISLAFIVVSSLVIDPAGGWPLNALVIPVIALAAAFGGPASWVVVAAMAFILAPVFVPGAVSTELSRRLLALAMAAGVTAVGSRRVVASLERSRDRVRRAQMLQRRRSRQLVAVEAVGRTLAREGPTTEALDTVMGVLTDIFGYTYPSIYTWDGHVLRLGAQRNYANPIPEFLTDRGVIGRVARTKQAAFLPDVSGDPDYVAANSEVVGEISVPLLSNDELLGVLNIETGRSRRLDADDVATMEIVADRVAAALALGRERQNLTERARLMDQLASFSRSLGRSLDPETVHAQVAAGAMQVVRSDMVVLVLLDRATGEYRIVGVEGGDPSLLGARILPGEGITGRAIAAGHLVVDDHLERSAYPRSAVGARVADTMAAMGAPLIAETDVIGAMSWFREDLTRPFTDQEREVTSLIAGQVALAIANAELHHATELAAVTDVLTGLHNRRFFDASMTRAEAARRREPEGERRPRSVIMFDLDHFGQVNKLHGHQVGDEILRAFGGVIRGRVRASDLAARYGGEEFVVVLDGATRTEAVRLAEEIRERFGALRFDLPDGSAIGCTVSAGCSSLAPSEAAGSLLIERADVGLAMAKASGRDRVVAA
jgi:diguanylate cyclase (GGDEF)-like protein